MQKKILIVRSFWRHNSVYDYELISICETSLDDTIEIPIELIKDYKFVQCNNPNNTKHGGVGLFYKDTLPIKVRNDFSFDESIVVGLLYGRKKIFSLFCIEALPVLLVLKPCLSTNIRKENPYAIFFTGDFNCHSLHWWPTVDTNAKGDEI